MWINLPRRSKFSPPGFKMLWAETLPHRVITAADTGATAEVTLIAGSLDGFDSPPSPPTHSYASEADSLVLVATVKLSAGERSSQGPTGPQPRRRLHDRRRAATPTARRVAAAWPPRGRRVAATRWPRNYGRHVTAMAVRP